jgi:hypothetical protein
MRAEPIEVTLRDSVYREYIQGRPETWYTVDHLQVEDHSILNMDNEVFQLIMKMDYTLESDVIIINWNTMGMIFERGAEDIFSAKFMCVGETKMIFEKG